MAAFAPSLLLLLLAETSRWQQPLPPAPPVDIFRPKRIRRRRRDFLWRFFSSHSRLMASILFSTSVEKTASNWMALFRSSSVPLVHTPLSTFIVAGQGPSARYLAEGGWRSQTDDWPCQICYRCTDRCTEWRAILLRGLRMVICWAEWIFFCILSTVPCATSEALNDRIVSVLHYAQRSCFIHFVYLFSRLKPLSKSIKLGSAALHYSID